MKQTRKWTILVTDENRPRLMQIAATKRLVRQLLHEIGSTSLPSETQEVSIVFSSNERIRKLNKEYRGKNRPTDVLSFSQLEGPGHPSPSLGDVIISVERAKTQCGRFRTTFSEELVRLLIHGLLHLHGFDHENVSRKELLRMKAEEKRLFSLFRHTKLLV
jgi:probable rRNA maturation factor